MQSSTVWLSYDLGATGDYEGLYAWLDNLDAKECSASVAFVSGYEHEGDLVEALREDICTHVEIGKRARVYVISKRANDRVFGKYVIGRRRSSPWEGYGDSLESDEDS